MFDLGWTELIVVAVVTILVVGPKELPGMLRTIGRSMGQMRRMAGDFQRQFNDALKEAELDDVQKAVESVNNINPTKQIKNSLNPIKQATEDVQREINTSLKNVGDTTAKATSDPGAVAETNAATPAKSSDEAAQT